MQSSPLSDGGRKGPTISHPGVPVPFRRRYRVVRATVIPPTNRCPRILSGLSDSHDELGERAADLPGALSVWQSNGAATALGTTAFATSARAERTSATATFRSRKTILRTWLLGRSCVALPCHGRAATPRRTGFGGGLSGAVCPPATPCGEGLALAEGQAERQSCRIRGEGGATSSGAR